MVIELQAVIFQYLRAYDRTTGKVLLEMLCEALPGVTEGEIKTATLNLIERFVSRRQTIDCLFKGTDGHREFLTNYIQR